MDRHDTLKFLAFVDGTIFEPRGALIEAFSKGGMYQLFKAFDVGQTDINTKQDNLKTPDVHTPWLRAKVATVIEDHKVSDMSCHNVHMTVTKDIGLSNHGGGHAHCLR